MSQYIYIEPQDVLYLRANKLFGDAGSYGQSQMPPWPSVIAGALRSAMLTADGIDGQAFAAGQVSHPVLGTPAAPGPFRLLSTTLARRRCDGCDALRAVPADLVITADSEAESSYRVDRLRPSRLSGISGSHALPLVPALCRDRAAKPTGGLWLDAEGWRSYLSGETPKAANLVKNDLLWRTDDRVGIGLDRATGRADDGKLFSMQAIAMRGDTGFLVAIDGGRMPEQGVLRFGGDGRIAHYREVPGYTNEQPGYEGIADASRCRLVLTSPGLFRSGWIPDGFAQDANGDWRLASGGLRGRLVCAAVPRAQVVSGWDLAAQAPKQAQRAAPAGSVYWIDELEAEPALMRKLASHGLWPEQGYDARRRAEGFNRFTFALF